MEVVAAVCSLAATLIVASFTYAQWRRTEKRQTEHEAANLSITEGEQRRASRAAYREARIQALRELTQTLKTMELESRWKEGGHDMRSEEPKLNSFLITHSAVLTHEESELARQFFEGLTWIDLAAERYRLKWERERRATLEASGIDIGPVESSWGTTRSDVLPSDDNIHDMFNAHQKWQSASQALDERLRDALQGHE
ncbi:hypothetical protein ACFV2D_34660 [Streptomyces capillispiralis]|uniref:hypothetical protein n=1 Tax=Streptomyces capillispiralis TaxID=68182 RepID=UPI00368DB242